MRINLHKIILTFSGLCILFLFLFAPKIANAAPFVISGGKVFEFIDENNVSHNIHGIQVDIESHHPCGPNRWGSWKTAYAVWSDGSHHQSTSFIKSTQAGIECNATELKDKFQVGCQANPYKIKVHVGGTNFDLNEYEPYQLHLYSDDGDLVNLSSNWNVGQWIGNFTVPNDRGGGLTVRFKKKAPPHELSCGSGSGDVSQTSNNPYDPVVVNFSGSANDVNYGHNLNYQFKYKSTDNGTNTNYINVPNGHFTNVPSGHSKSVSITFNGPENGDLNPYNAHYSVYLEVTDTTGEAPMIDCHLGNVTINIKHTVTLSCSVVPGVGTVPLFVKLTAIANDNFAPGGVPIPNSGSHVLTYTWDFGDGTSGVTTTDTSIIHAYTAIGTRIATVSVSHAANSLSTPVLPAPCSCTINAKDPGEGASGEVSP